MCLSSAKLRTFCNANKKSVKLLHSFLLRLFFEPILHLKSAPQRVRYTSKKLFLI
nr:MAG TPA: hypothetical protein [Caudoviricetes sp.]